MRANVVVPISKYVEIAVQLREVWYLPLVELVFQRAKQSLDPAVLPRASRCGALMTDAQFLQSLAKCP